MLNCVDGFVCTCEVACRNHVLLEDVEYFLDKTKAKECFDMLDLDRDGKVSLQVQPCSLAVELVALLLPFSSASP